MSASSNRRLFLLSTGIGSASLLLGCRETSETAQPDPNKGTTSTTGADTPPKSNAGGSDEPEVTATEDLMREHGVIRRAIIVYREAAARLRTKTTVPADALQRSAKLFRSFGEDYHERQLEEAHIFPALTRVGGAAAKNVETLLAQHNRGREITDYILAVTRAAITPAHAAPLALTLEAFARMYEEHTAIEDTVIFPAWKKTMNAKQLDEIGDVFEDIEHKTFGKDGFDYAVDEITVIEKNLGIELASMTAPSPPKA